VFCAADDGNDVADKASKRGEVTGFPFEGGVCDFMSTGGVRATVAGDGFEEGL
jgi:hypothetical protein